MPDLNDAAPAADEPSLRDTIASELDKASTPAEEAPASEPVVPETPAQRTERERDQAGRFTSKSAQQQQAPLEQQPPETQPQEAQPSVPTATADPPPWWSPTNKSEWSKLPETIRQSIRQDNARREAEVAKGFEEYKAIANEFKPLEPFIDMAKRTGTTLPEAIQRYVAAEQLLERDPISGLKWLMQNYNIDPRQLMDGAPPAAGQPTQPQVMDLRPYLQPFAEKLNYLEQTVIGNEQAKINSEIGTFFDDTKAHPYAENVADQMATLLKSGVTKSLQDAYDAACWNDPEIRGLLINQQFTAKTADQAAKAKQVANQARLAGQSITGGPAATPASGVPEKDNLREVLEEAVLGGGRA
jgi:hypothetical protein